MNINKYRSILEILIVSLLAYAGHKLLFYFNSGNPKLQNFHTSLESVYGFFTLCSVTILFILIQVKSRKAENIGFTFLLLTCAKMGIAYAFLRPILHSGNSSIATEKINFFLVFAIFLTIETVVTIRILNKKD